MNVGRERKPYDHTETARQAGIELVRRVGEDAKLKPGEIIYDAELVEDDQPLQRYEQRTQVAKRTTYIANGVVHTVTEELIQVDSHKF